MKKKRSIIVDVFENIASGGLRNGLTFWKIQSGSGKWITLKEYAQKAKKR